jgi:phosphate starvation-inducible protein PhoH and related proteins
MGNKNGLKLKLHGNSIFATRSKNQTKYVEDILTSFITFGSGEAGTGKTIAACAVALHLLHQKQIERIILSRPVVEAGESLGFLPGSAEEKMEPYMLPFFHSMTKLVGKQIADKLFEEGRIEILPLAFTRGLTYENAVVIIDEAQNITKLQMKMCLTRLGENSKIIVNGDPSQCDLPKPSSSGLLDAINRLDGKKGISVTAFDTSDVVRHQIVKVVIDAYKITS